MSNCIQLINKATKEPESFVAIDEKLCKALNVPCDPNHYYQGWYMVLGYSMKNTINEVIKAQIHHGFSAHGITALMWLDTHYELNAWCERGRQANSNTLYFNHRR